MLTPSQTTALLIGSGWTPPSDPDEDLFPTLHGVKRTLTNLQHDLAANLQNIREEKRTWAVAHRKFLAHRAQVGDRREHCKKTHNLAQAGANNSDTNGGHHNHAVTTSQRVLPHMSDTKDGVSSNTNPTAYNKLVSTSSTGIVTTPSGMGPREALIYDIYRRVKKHQDCEEIVQDLKQEDNERDSRPENVKQPSPSTSSPLRRESHTIMITLNRVRVEDEDPSELRRGTSDVSPNPRSLNATDTKNAADAENEWLDLEDPLSLTGSAAAYAQASAFAAAEKAEISTYDYEERPGEIGISAHLMPKRRRWQESMFPVMEFMKDEDERVFASLSSDIKANMSEEKGESIEGKDNALDVEEREGEYDLFFLGE